MNTISALIALLCLIACVAVYMAWDKIIGLFRKGYDFGRKLEYYVPDAQVNPKRKRRK
jgi:hypothetical protein